MQNLKVFIVFTMLSGFFAFYQPSQKDVSNFFDDTRYSNVSEIGYGEDKDGYIYKGKITLYRVGSGHGDTFDLYVKSSTRYVKYKGSYYKIDGVQYVTINNVKYKTR